MKPWLATLFAIFFAILAGVFLGELAMMVVKP